jgi:hypothetical protein
MRWSRVGKNRNQRIAITIRSGVGAKLFLGIPQILSVIYIVWFWMWELNSQKRKTRLIRPLNIYYEWLGQNQI